jgi:integrase
LHVHRLITDTGRRVAVLIGPCGVPVRLAQLWLFRSVWNDSIRTQYRKMLRLAELFEVMGDDFEDRLLSGVVSAPEVQEALRTLERRQEATRWLHNQRVAVWSEFLSWAFVRSNWVTGPHRREYWPLMESDNDRANHLKAVLADLAEPTPASAARPLLATRELEVLDELLRPAVEPPRSILDDSYVPWRRYVAWLLLRFGGIRCGELLKLKRNDFPPRESSVDSEIRSLTDAALVFNVTRRPDDEEDSRLDEPGTKRHGRGVMLPDACWPFIWDFLECETPSTYLIASQHSGHPLSQRAFYSWNSSFRAIAASEFEARWPGDPHHLRELTPHLLRHRRAIELLPIFFPEGKDTAIGRQRFRAQFGWKNEAASDPYIRRLNTALADATSATIRQDRLDAAGRD